MRAEQWMHGKSGRVRGQCTAINAVVYRLELQRIKGDLACMQWVLPLKRQQTINVKQYS